MDCFPPFCLLHRVVHKLKEEKADVIMIAPLWTTQPWFSALTRLLLDLPVVLPRRPDLLLLPFDPDRRHPLLHKMILMARRLSGKAWESKAFRQRLRKSSSNPGGRGTEKQDAVYLQKWESFASGQNFNLFQPIITHTLDFLTELFENGLGYSSINIARCQHCQQL